MFDPSPAPQEDRQSFHILVQDAPCKQATKKYLRIVLKGSKNNPKLH